MPRSVFAVPLAGLLAAALASVALAGPAQASGSQPAGYVVVKHGPISLSPQALIELTAQCPSGKVPLGGGVYTPSTSVHVNVDELDSIAGGFESQILNFSSATTTATVYAICADKPGNYARYRSAWLDIGPNSQRDAVDTTCPKGQPLSGGMVFDFTSSVVEESINTSMPRATGWRIDANNNNRVSNSIQATLVCGTVAGYHMEVGGEVLNPAGTQTGSAVQCSSGVPVGGGSLSSSSSINVAINSSYPEPGGWVTYMNNASSSDEFVTPFVICAS